MATIKTKVLILKELLALKEIIDVGGIQAAANKNGIKTSNMSKLLNDLESRLGVQLINRKTTGSFPTNSTQLLYSEIENISNNLNNILNNFIDFTDLTGFISIWVEEGLVGSFILRDLSYFYAQYPKIRLELFTKKEPNIKDVDILIVDKKLHPNINGTTLFKFKVKAPFYSSNDYLEKHGTPKNIDDLLQNYDLCLPQYYLDFPECKEIIKKAKHLNTTSDSITLIYRLIISGDGISIIPSWFSKLNKNLIQLKNIDFSLDYEIHCICKPELSENKKIRAFTQFFINYCSKNGVKIDILN